MNKLMNKFIHQNFLMQPKENQHEFSIPIHKFNEETRSLKITRKTNFNQPNDDETDRSLFQIKLI